MKSGDIVSYNILNASGRWGPGNPPSGTVLEVGHDEVLLDFGFRGRNDPIWVPRSEVTLRIEMTPDPLCGCRDCNRP